MGILNVEVADAISAMEKSLKNFELKKKVYSSLLKGQGVEFESYGNYENGLDASRIDWRASARTNKLMIRNYKIEANKKIMFFVDVGESMVSGSEKKLKCEYVGEIAVALYNLILKNGDAPGFSLFSEKEHEIFLPNRQKSNWNYFVSEILNGENYGGKSDFYNAFKFVNENLIGKINSLIVLSDFIGLDKSAEKEIKKTAFGVETTFISVKDPTDISLPDVEGEILIQDPASDNQIIVNPSLVSEIYKKEVGKKMREFKNFCIDSNINLLELLTNQDYIEGLIKFLSRRR